MALYYHVTLSYEGTFSALLHVRCGTYLLQQRLLCLKKALNSRQITSLVVAFVSRRNLSMVNKHWLSSLNVLLCNHGYMLRSSSRGVLILKGSDFWRDWTWLCLVWRSGEQWTPGRWFATRIFIVCHGLYTELNM